MTRKKHISASAFRAQNFSRRVVVVFAVRYKTETKSENYRGVSEHRVPVVRVHGNSIDVKNINKIPSTMVFSEVFPM